MDVVVRTAKEEDWENLWFLLEKRGGTDDRTSAEKRFLAYVQSPSHYIPVPMPAIKPSAMPGCKITAPICGRGKASTAFMICLCSRNIETGGSGPCCFSGSGNGQKKTALPGCSGMRIPHPQVFMGVWDLSRFRKKRKGFPFSKSNFKPGNDSVPGFGRTALPCFPLPLLASGSHFRTEKRPGRLYDQGKRRFLCKGGGCFTRPEASGGRLPSRAFRIWIELGSAKNKMTARFRGSSCFLFRTLSKGAFPPRLFHDESSASAARNDRRSFQP